MHVHIIYKYIFSLQFHPELNPIEKCWGKAKAFARVNCDYSMEGLRGMVPNALDTVSLDLIRKFFRECRDYNRAYLGENVPGEEGAKTGRDADIKIKEYKSHRRVSLTT